MALTAAHSNPNAPSIDRTAAQRVLSARMLRNVVQGAIWVDGRGLQEAWADSAEVFEVRVLKHEGITSYSRTVGEDGTENNKYFNENDTEQPSHTAALLKLNEVYDRTQTIPQLMEDVIQINILNLHAQRIEERIRQLMNGYTLAKKAIAALQYAEDESDDSRIIKFEKGSDDMMNKLLEAHSLLNDGDPDNFIDTFPREGRVAVFDVTGQQELYKANGSVFQVGSSRAIELLEIGSAGGLEPGRLNNEVNGYFGELYGSPLHFMTSIILSIADEYIDYDGAADKLKGNLYGIVSASEATGRGFGIARSTKIVDTRGGQGFELQPLVRWGVTVWYPKGIVLIVDHEYTNPASLADLTMEGPESKST